MFGGVESRGGGGSCIGEYLLCLWVKIMWVRSGLAMEITVGLWWVSGGDQGRGCKLVVAVRAVLFWLLIAMNLLLLITVDIYFILFYFIEIKSRNFIVEKKYKYVTTLRQDN